MSNNLVIDEDLVQRLPLPLAQLYRRAFNADSALQRHQAAFYVWEAAVKLLGAAAVLEYAERNLRDPGAARELQALARPTLGHWWGFSRTLVPLLAKAGEPAFQHLHASLTGDGRKDLTALSALDAGLRSVSDGHPASPGPIRLHDLFDRLLRYRNDEIGHGSFGMRPDAFYAEKADLLLAAAPELFGTVDVLAGRRLVYVSSVHVHRSGDWEVDTFELVGEVPRKAPPLRVPSDPSTAMPMPERLYLRRPDGAALGDGALPRLGALHPLVVYNGAKRVVYFLNAQRDRRPAEYLDYVDSDRLSRAELTDDLSAFLSRVLGDRVDPPTVERWAAAADPAPPATPPNSSPAPPNPPPAPPETAMKVMLSYKRNAQPDEQVLLALERGLKARGLRVFVDRHLTIGDEWAREINRQVREADAVVVLLSAASVHSEMVEHEVEIAVEAARVPTRGGRPRLLPVRVAYEDRLPAKLAGHLDRLQYFLWKSPADDALLLDKLAAALAGPAPAVRDLPSPTGALPLDTPFYVERDTDAGFQQALDSHDSFVRVCGPRQVGKTSLLTRGYERARERGFRVVFTDLQAIGDSALESITAFYLTLAREIAEELNLPADPGASWDSSKGPNRNFEMFLRKQVLEPTEVPLVWFLDEVDQLFNCGFGNSVFGLFRSWHNARGRLPVWKRLTMAIGYATEAHLFITNLNQSPFNVGIRLALGDFTAEQVAWLNGRYGSQLRGADVETFYALVGGHPYLTNRGLDHLARTGVGLAAFEQAAARDDGPFGDHLHRLLVLLANDRDMADAVRAVVRREGYPSADKFYRLRSAGVLAGPSAPEARPRCGLYTRYLELHLR